jgi:hypothetical protein
MKPAFTTALDNSHICYSVERLMPSNDKEILINGFNLGKLTHIHSVLNYQRDLACSALPEYGPSKRPVRLSFFYNISICTGLKGTIYPHNRYNIE